MSLEDHRFLDHRHKVKPKRHHHAKHANAYLGHRVRVTHPPDSNYLSKSLVYKSGIVVGVNAIRAYPCYDIIMDDGRRVEVPRNYLEIDRMMVYPVEIFVKAEGLENFDL